jgi:hypothetical protein
MRSILRNLTQALLCASGLLLAGPLAAGKPSLAADLARVAPELDPAVLHGALGAMYCAIAHGAGAAQRLAVIDFSLPSSERRIWIFDLDTRSVLLHDLVAHGQGSGGDLAKVFSNREGSHQSSIGLFRTSESYYGKHGYSLRMDGLEPGINDKARERAIVIHAADYVDASWVTRQGRIGRSQGCPAVNPAVASLVVDSLKGGQFMFAWYPDEHWLATSSFLNCPDPEGSRLALQASPATDERL